MENGKWVVSGLTQQQADVKTGVWMFVAIVYDSVALSVNFFVDGVMASLSASSLPATPSILNASTVIGSSESANTGFAGSIKSVFFYDEALNEHELRYLMTSSVAHPPLTVGRWGHSFQQTDDSVQASLNIPSSAVGDLLATGSLMMWVAPEGLQEQPFCLCQLTSASRARTLTIWSAFDQRVGVSYLRLVDFDGASYRLSENLYPEAVVSTDGRWQHVGVTWGSSFVHVSIDAILKVCCTRTVCLRMHAR